MSRLLLGLAVFSLLACSSGDPDPSPDLSAPLSVRVMTFNLRWDGFDDGKNAWAHRRDVVYRVLEDFGPDSIGTQEPMSRQTDDIVAAIPGLSCYQYDDGSEYERTQQILYRNDRFDLADSGGFLLVAGDHIGGTIRHCTWVRLRDRETGRCYYHYNVHLDHRDLTSREKSVVSLVKHIAAREHDDPFVVTGDFNTGEKSTPMRFLRGEQPLPDLEGNPFENPILLVDTFRLLYPDAPESGTGSGFRGLRRTGSKIDHVLVAAGAAEVSEAAIVRTEVDGRYPSDHFPVFAVFTWPGD